MKITVSPGPGGSDAKDFVGILIKMYEGWATRNGYASQLTGDGIVINADGSLLPNESGTHRLTRYSPHDPQHRRTTCFAYVQVIGQSRFNDDVLRTYIIDPYQSVTDRRTNAVVVDVDSVLAGDFTDLCEQYVKPVAAPLEPQ